MKRTLLVATVGMLGILLLLAACTTQPETGREQQPYKFGAVLPLTGDKSFYGDFAKSGIELAVEDINAAGGVNGVPVQAVYEDSAGDKAKATIAAQKLIDIDWVDALFAITTPMGGAVAPVAEANKVPLIYGSAVNSFTEGKKYVFKDYPDASDECELLMTQALKDHQRVAMFGTNAEFTQLCKQGAERVGKLAIFETYAPGETDFRTQFTKIANSQSTALILLAFAGDCVNAFKQVGELGLDVQFYLPFQQFGCGTFENSKAYADLLKNAYGAEVAADETNPKFADVKQRLERRGWTTQILGSAIMYDGVWEMAKAYEGCGHDTLCAANNLRYLNYQGASGTVSYNGKQIVKRDFFLFKFENGEWRRTE